MDSGLLSLGVVDDARGSVFLWGIGQENKCGSYDDA
jgi:hypothetical protein